MLIGGSDDIGKRLTRAPQHGGRRGLSTAPRAAPGAAAGWTIELDACELVTNIASLAT